MNGAVGRGAPAIKVGLAAMCAAWFREVGLQGEAGGLADTTHRDFVVAADELSRVFGDVVMPGIISTVEEAAAASRQFADASVDAIVLLHLMWSEDPPLAALLEACRGLPVILWNYHPTGSLPEYLSTDDLFRHSGTVGALQGSAVLERLRVRPLMVTGTPGDADLAQQMADVAAGLRIRREMLGMPAGRIAGMCPVMAGTAVDEAAMESQLGAKLIDISAEEYAAACHAVGASRVRQHLALVRDRHRIEGVSDASLQLACRNTLALDDLVARYGLGAVGIQDLDPDLHRLAGIRPCLCPPLSADLGVPYGMEADLNATLGMLAAMRASGAPAMYTEIFTYDPRANQLLMGHAGVHDPRLASTEGVTIVPDYEYRHSDALEGAWQEFIMAPGAVTCVSLYDSESGYRLTTFEGESVGGAKRLQGFAHAVVRPEVPAATLLNRLLRAGLTQHFAVARGHVSGALAQWCRLSGIQYRAADRPAEA
jgi:L-arabinose isomerase